MFGIVSLMNNFLVPGAAFVAALREALLTTSPAEASRWRLRTTREQTVSREEDLPRVGLTHAEVKNGVTIRDRKATLCPA